eukprot:59450-Rhodomonas_salina.1
MHTLVHFCAILLPTGPRFRDEIQRAIIFYPAPAPRVGWAEAAVANSGCIVAAVASAGPRVVAACGRQRVAVARCNVLPSEAKVVSWAVSTSSCIQRIIPSPALWNL